MADSRQTDAHRMAEENILLAFKFASNHSRPQEDVLTYAYEGLLRACQKFDPKKATLGTYAFRWMQQRTNRFLGREERNERRNVPVLGNDDWMEIFSHDTMEDDVLDRLVRDDVRARLPAAIGALSAKHRDALSLYFGLYGHRPRPHTEVAKELGVSTEAARLRVVGALERLRARLAP